MSWNDQGGGTSRAFRHCPLDGRACSARKNHFFCYRPGIAECGSIFLHAGLVILTTDFGWSSRGVVITKPVSYVVRARSSSTVFSKTHVLECAITFRSSGKPARAR